MAASETVTQLLGNAAPDKFVGLDKDRRVAEPFDSRQIEKLFLVPLDVANDDGRGFTRQGRREILWLAAA
jgi:hypothetical protein